MTHGFVTSSGVVMFGGRRGRRTDAVPADTLPHPGVEDPVRAFAYDAVRAAPSALWVVVPGSLDDAIGTITGSIPELASTGVRWSGAGVLTGLRTEWWAFDGAEASVLLFTSDALELVGLRTGLRSASRDLVQHEVMAPATPPADVLETCAAARAVPVWQLPGFARHAPRALLESGFATIAA